MKTNFLALAVVAMFALGCDEEVLIQKEYIRDTLIVEKFVDRYFSNTDTVEIPVTIEVPTPTRVQDTIINVTDTLIIERVDTIYKEVIVYVPRVDSVFITTYVHTRDTIVVREYTYGDTLYIYTGRSTYEVDPSLQPIVTAFYTDARGYGKTPPGGLLRIIFGPLDNAQQALSFEAYGQLNVIINEQQTADESYLPLTRELARHQLGKQYSSNPESLLYPFYQTDEIRYSNRDQYKERLKELFL